MNDYFLADDLSGALDAAAAFHHAGRRVTIALSTDAWPEAGPDDVVGFTTETRNAQPEAAARAVRRAIARGSERGGRLLYKKIDSTLRGPVAAEVAALMAALPEVRVLFAPANPRVERSVRDGRLLVRGVPVAETEFGRDPVCPVRESSIRALLGVTANERVDIPDTATEADLQAAVARMDAAGSPWVPVGSGALARPVAAREAVVTRPGNAGNSIPATGPILMIGGSAHPGNRAQAARLTTDRGVSVIELTGGAGAEGLDGSAVASALIALSDRGAVALLSPRERLPAAEALATIVATARGVIEYGRVGRIFVTGGETAFALAGALGVTTFQFEAEIEAGLALACSGPGGQERWWAVKPGGFGDEQTWVRAYDALGAGIRGSVRAPERGVG
jgi:uncharacterized protein YgbK (DUF1537 family)